MRPSRLVGPLVLAALAAAALWALSAGEPRLETRRGALTSGDPDAATAEDLLRETPGPSRLLLRPVDPATPTLSAPPGAPAGPGPVPAPADRAPAPADARSAPD